jgi:hypothetical protein
MPEYFKRFPPQSGVVRVPTSSRASALAGLTMYSPCRPAAVFAHRMAWVTTALFGPVILPGRARPWICPIESQIWSDLLEAWSNVIGAFDTFAVYERPPGPRPGLAILLIKDGQSVGFVKVRRNNPEALANEARALQLVWASRPRSFLVSEPLDAGQIAGWHYLMVTSSQSRLHRMPRDCPLRSILEEVGVGLEALPRSADVPRHWVPMHGDLSVWNLREALFGRTPPSLMDWEYAGWGPPGADETWYRASLAAVAGIKPSASAHEEAILYWEDWVRSWSTADPMDARSVLLLLGALASMHR